MKKLGVWLLGGLLMTALPVLAQHEGGDSHGGGQPHGGAPQQQHGDSHGGGGFGGGYIPQHGPERGGGQPQGHMDNRGGGQPQGRMENHGGGQPQGHMDNRGGDQGHQDFHDAQGHPNQPHVDPGGHWVGHEGGGGGQYHLDHPWEHGHFPGHIGNSYVYRLGGGGPNRFFFNGFYFGVAGPDMGYVNGWDWASDDVVLYDDPDDPGYYLAYNPRLGVYVHVSYLGR